MQAVLPALSAALARHGSAVLQAPPGAGKTTLVPPALLDQACLSGGKIVMVAPRRLAARSAAARIADLLGEPVGQRAGYRVRLESRVSAATRIEVMTPGVYLRLLQADPSLADVGLVIFDEVHERGLETDLALALTLDARAVLAPDVRLLAMSATVAADQFAALLGDCPVIHSDGRAFPVDIRHWDHDPDGRPADLALLGIARARRETDGDMLVFLPGIADIRRTEAALRDAPDLAGDCMIATLYGDMALADQARILSPPDQQSQRRIILATAIAETSLTIPGIAVVIDTGRSRQPGFDPASGMRRLETVRVSQAAAAQRAGRAGRTGPGTCYRLWTAARHRGLLAYTPPEIAHADLAPLALELALWGTDPADLRWLDAPPPGPLAQARQLLTALGALDKHGVVGDHGRAMGALGTHPRLAHMLLKSRGTDAALRLACVLAALLSERDPRTARTDKRVSVDMAALLPMALRDKQGPVMRQARRWLRQFGAGEVLDGFDPDAIPAEQVGRTLALAYPDRVAKALGKGVFQTLGGRRAQIYPHDPLASAPFLAIATMRAAPKAASVQAAAGVAQIVQAAALAEADVRHLYADDIHTQTTVRWDPRAQDVVAQRQEQLGAIVLARGPAPADLDARAALLDGLRQSGLRLLPWTDAARQWQARVGLMARTNPSADWPDLSNAHLLAHLADWLAPFLSDARRRADLARLDLLTILKSLLTWPQQQQLSQAAPETWTLPSGRDAAIDYQQDPPVLAVKLQELFGQTQAPTVLDGQLPLAVHLLSPAGRPLAVTRDLVTFWQQTYPQVRAEMRGRYPKHPWPEDPLTATPTAWTKKRLSKG